LALPDREFFLYVTTVARCDVVGSFGTVSGQTMTHQMAAAAVAASQSHRHPFSLCNRLAKGRPSPLCHWTHRVSRQVSSGGKLWTKMHLRRASILREQLVEFGGKLALVTATARSSQPSAL
jgi:hypothetical protein